MANQYTLKNGGYEPFIGNYGLVPQPPIPEPEAADNGKVLGVAEGQYALVSGGGGGGSNEPLIVTITYSNDAGHMAYTCDKTWKQIYDALSEGTPVVGLCHYTTYDSEMGVTEEFWESEPCTYASKYVQTGSEETSASFTVIFNGSSFTADSENGYPIYEMY